MNTRRFLVLAAACFAAFSLQSASAETWAEKLGFGKNSRVVIVSAREMGLCWEANEAGKSLVDAKKIETTEVMVTGPWFPDFAQWCRRHPSTDVGLSVVLTNPYDQIQWRLLSQDHSPSLANADGRPWQHVTQMASIAVPEDVEREIDAQIRQARQAGVPISHLTSYYGTIFARADLAAVYLAASRKHWLPAPVVDLTPEMIKDFEKQGFPLDENLIQLIQHYPLPKLDHIAFMPDAETLEAKRSAYIEMLKNLPAGLTQIVVTPSVPGKSLQHLAKDSQQRVWSGRLLADSQVEQSMTQLKIERTNWRDVMHRFENGTPQPKQP